MPNEQGQRFAKRAGRPPGLTLRWTVHGAVEYCVGQKHMTHLAERVKGSISEPVLTPARLIVPLCHGPSASDTDSCVDPSGRRARDTCSNPVNQTIQLRNIWSYSERTQGADTWTDMEMDVTNNHKKEREAEHQTPGAEARPHLGTSGEAGPGPGCSVNLCQRSDSTNPY